jgi:hypothetical protein
MAYSYVVGKGVTYQVGSSMTDSKVFTASIANRRRARRLALNQQTRLECRKGSAGLGRNLALTTLDLSETGARLTVQASLAVRDEVEIKVSGTGIPKPVRRLGTVVWSVLLQDGNHAIGVVFDKAMAFGDLQRLTRA